MQLKTSLSPERICMLVYSIPFPSIGASWYPWLCQRELSSSSAVFASPILPWLWECWVLTAVLKQEECAKTEGFPCEAVTSCSFAVTCYVVVNADSHSWPIPLWSLPLLPGRRRLCNQHSSLVSRGAAKRSRCPSPDWIHVLAWCTVCTTGTWTHAIVQWQKQKKKSLMARRNPQINSYCQSKYLRFIFSGSVSMRS